jgi:hypothetical protein
MTVFSCRCGQVAYEVTGQPIISVACHCDDCQAGGAQLAALPGATSVLDEWAGTPYLMYRKDAMRCVRGEHLLRRLKLAEGTWTSRVVASCCNTPMVVDFNRGPHWVSAYRARFGPEAPPLEYRVQLRFASPGRPLPNDVRTYRSYPLSFVGRLVAARIAMFLGPPKPADS